MGIQERRERERARRRREILDAAWEVARSLGWSAFSVEKVALQAELARGTIYTYFSDIGTLVTELGREALSEFSQQLARANGLSEALDVPVRFSQRHPAAFRLLFPHGELDRAYLGGPELEAARSEAQELLGALQRLAAAEGQHLPADAREAAAFLSGIGLAGALVPELRASTTLRHRWQDFCLGSETRPGNDD
ncbi:MAG: TetR/AcrR family transcriptional regulator [Polyangiaceae bacterium]